MTSDEQNRWIAEAVDLIDARMWTVLEQMDPEDADLFFEALSDSIHQTKLAYWEHVEGAENE